MPTTEQITKLVEARTQSLKKALEDQDIDTILSWHAEESKFFDPLRGVDGLPRSQLRDFYAVPFNNMQSSKIVSSKVTAPTPYFDAWEIVGESVAMVDDPLGEGTKVGHKLVANLVSLIWWEWKGEGEWNGDLSEESIRKWKIVGQHDYCVPQRASET
ncbi:hypothetical protein PRZ48_009682 [Zasmidium cellare]|uniref:SnoaL-like domain-containing protein n=1 Tax=Zasmidium cellare TaxID=395010 RepID=A0ABR0EDE2_ZASCE|nr:hypothetical protein PRZ48_009682 [Zasmidium cellare]